MTTRDDVHRKVGEALGLAQALEIGLTAPILMLSLIESGHASQDLSTQDVLTLIKEDKARERPTAKLRTMDDKLRERLRQELISVAMLVQNGTMGELRKKLQHYLRSSPGGPPAPLDELQDALEARNYLCHEFFKEYGADIEQGQGMDSALARLDALQDDFRAAIAFCDRLTGALRQAFPKTFDKQEPDQVH